MAAQDKAQGAYGWVNVGSVTTTGANESIRCTPPVSHSVPLLQRNFLTAGWPPSEIWRPVGIAYIITTGITVTNAVVQLMKNGVAPNGPLPVATAGIATLPIAALGANEIYAAFSDYTFAAADALTDVWSIKVLTTSTAGVVNPVRLVYATKLVAGLNDGVTL